MVCGRMKIRQAAFRFLCFFGVWLLMNGVGDAWIGAAAAATAALLSLRLLPPSPHRIRWRLVPWFVVRLLWSSVAAGVDVALRAFKPRLNLRPGFVVVPCRVPEGTARAVFASISSLVPGSLATGEEQGGQIIHCLDLGLPVKDAVAADEARFMKLLGGGEAHG